MDKVARDLTAHADANLKAIGVRLAQSISAVRAAVDWMVPAYGTNPRAAHAVSVPYLKLWGLVAGGWQLGRGALVSARHLTAGSGDARFLSAKIQTARYYAEALLPQAGSLSQAVMGAGESALSLAAEQF
jgi:acyl-CoA dehydrogenase